MKQQPDWITKLKKKFEKLDRESQPHNWSLQNYAIFFEIEYGLRLHELVFSDVAKRDCRDTWALISGYYLPDIHADEVVRHACAVARHQLRYTRSSTTWRRWVKWYGDQKSWLRLYDIDLTTGKFTQNPKQIYLRGDRLKVYDDALSRAPEPKARTLHWAEAGDYTFRIDGIPYRVSIPTSLADLKSNIDIPTKLPKKEPRQPIIVDFTKLKVIAKELDELTGEKWWLEQLGKMQFALVEKHGLIHNAQSFTIDGLFHLVGMVGAGKSTLINLLTYYLVKYEGLHVTIMVNTVVEGIQLATWFEKVGVPAAPVLGTQRGIHREKYGLANAENLRPEQVFGLPNVTASDPALRWLTAPCVLSGASLNRNGPIPAGKEPCFTLYGNDDKRYICPVLPVCPVHQASQDLVQNRQNQVWIVNSASFLYTPAPLQWSRTEMNILEAVYRVSDLLIIDEADRVQVQWDQQFAPTNDLFGDEDALLDYVHKKVSAQSVGRRGRQRMVNDLTRQLTVLDDQTNTLSNLITYLLGNYRDLAKWAKRARLINPSMYEQLADDLSRPEKGAAINEEVRRDLLKTFRPFWTTPLARSGGELTEWIYTVLRDNLPARRLMDYLEKWLAKQLPWEMKDRKRTQLMVRRLAFCLLLTTTNRRIDDIVDRWNAAATEFGTLENVENGPPDKYITLVPDPPVGRVLGNQYVESGNELGGIMKYTRYRGIGRWLLLNFHDIYADLDNTFGPHVFLTSATSWSPGSPQFHLAKSPDAVLSPPSNYLDAISTSSFFAEFVPDEHGLITVSGRSGEEREHNLAKLVRYLAAYDDDEQSRLDQELTYWRERGVERRILLIVGSYSEAKLVVRSLREFPRWRNNVRRLIADDDPDQDVYALRRGGVETLREYNADVLVAPLLAIQRGFNILDDIGGALLGSVFFLVRPYPIPHDLNQHIMGINAWALRKLENRWRFLPARYAQFSTAGVRKLRHDALRQQWLRRLGSSGSGLDGMDKDLYRELLWNQFVVIWQTVGRLVRQGRPARVFFMDAKFAPQGEHRQMLAGWLEQLGNYLEHDSKKPIVEQELARLLYKVVYDAMKRDLAHLGRKG